MNAQSVNRVLSYRINYCLQISYVSRHKISSYSILVISLQLIIGCKSGNDRLVIIVTMLGNRTVAYLFTDSKDMQHSYI